MQSYQPGVYNEEIARAFQWLAESVVSALMREREDAARESRLLDGDDLGAGPVSVVDVVEAFGHRLEQLRDKVTSIAENDLSDPDAVRTELIDLRDMCQRAQSEINELLMRPSAEAQVFLDKLTAREQEVALLLADDLTNDEIANELGITVPTVKSHVTRVLDKFGVRQRAAVAATPSVWMKAIRAPGQIYLFWNGWYSAWWVYDFVVDPPRGLHPPSTSTA